MLPINIDLNEVINEFNLSPEQGNELGEKIISNIIIDYFQKWENVVNRNLHSSRADYKSAMAIDRKSPLEVDFVLSYKNNKLAEIIEEGISPYDEKEYFKKSPKAKTKKGGGWYITIPFRHATPGSIADSISFASVLPKEVYAIAKVSTEPLKYNDLPNQYRNLGVREEVLLNGEVSPSYQHKVPIYQGLQRIKLSSTPNENRGGYFTFRRASDISAVNSWINRGMVAKKLMDKALNEINIGDIVDSSINDYLKIK